MKTRPINYLAALAFIGALSLGPTVEQMWSAPSRENTRERDDAPIEMREAPRTDTDPIPSRPAPAAAAITPEQLSLSFRAVAEEVMPVVVEVNVIEVIRQNIPRSSSPWDFFFGPGQQAPQQREFERPGLGSGVIVARRGETAYVVTNNHVVGEAREISVRLHDRREFEATIVGRDARTDLAVLAFEPGEDVPIAVLGDSDDTFVGEWVLAIGNPFGFESTVTSGIISAVRRRPGAGSGIADFTDYIQTDAAINPGNSGGALVNLRGEIIGINTWIASRSGGSVGLGFAVPVNTAKRVITDVLERGRVAYGWLGVSIADATPRTLPGVAEDLGIDGRPGALVMNVNRDSPADKAGVLPGDFITAINGSEVADANNLTRVVGLIPPGSTARFSIVRLGRELEIDVTLAERATDGAVADGSQLWPGITVIPIDDAIRENLDLSSEVTGVTAARVDANSPSATAGLRPGDVVTRVNDRPVASVIDFYRELNATNGDEVRFRVYRGGREFIIGLVR